MQFSLRMSGKRLGVAGAVLVVIFALSAHVLFKGKQAAPAPIPVRVVAAEGAVSAAGLRYSASIKPHEQVELAFKVDGYVREIVSVKGPDGSVRELRAGDHVSRGMVLARLDDKDHAAYARQARAALAESQAALVQAQKDHERAHSLVAGGYLARSEYDQALAKFNAARAKHDGARAQLEQADNQLADSQLRSPMDGVVASRSVERGTLVASGTKAFVLVDLSSVKAVFGVADAQLASIKPGGPLSVYVDALGRGFTGNVTSVSPSADAANRVFDVEVTIPNADGALKDGMIAAVQMDGAAAQGGAGSSGPTGGAGQGGGASVPLQAVVRQTGNAQGYMVFVVTEKDGRAVAQARPVKLGDVSGRSVSVLEGLRPGEQVATAGAAQLYDGAVVAVIP
ncbi:efflux RND transporter periplasmic adaptor subunit [Humidesulfovibrio idahonensis]